MEEKLPLKTSKNNLGKKFDTYYNPYKIDITTYIIILLLISIFVVLLILIPEIFKKQDIVHYDYIIIGSGLYGSVFNYIARQRNKTTLIIEKKKSIGGHLYCFKSSDIYVHKYGPKILHTNNRTIWELANKIVEFIPYYSQPITKINGKVYSGSYNMWLFNQLWGINSPDEAKQLIDEQKYKGDISNLEDQIKSFIGMDLYIKFFENYIEKIFGRSCPNLPPFIISMIPVSYRYDTNYYSNDRYQGIPESCYGDFVKKCLRYTQIVNNVDYIKYKSKYEPKADHVIFTGKIDEYYNYRYGALEYTTFRYEHVLKKTQNFQGAAIVNYLDEEIPYNRIIEHKHFQPYNKKIQNEAKTIVSYEYNEPWDRYKEPYYPINDKYNHEMYLKYKALADQEEKVIFGGRLGKYKHYEMEDVFKEVLEYFDG